MKTFEQHMTEMGLGDLLNRAVLDNDRALRMYNELQPEVTNCIQCELHATCAGPIPGFGSYTANLMIVAEAPGANEDDEGTPLIGDSGKMLTLLLNEARISRKQVYITNAVKCRPPHNRQPEPEEIEACRFHLINEIKWIRPKAILTLGNTPMRSLRRSSTLGITKARGLAVPKKFGNFETTLIHTFHPSFLLRQDDETKFKAAYEMMQSDLNLAFEVSLRK